MSTDLDAAFARRFPRGPVIHGTVSVPADRFSVTVLFGPSGSGKTTILRCLAGLDRPDEGHIRFGEETWFDAARGVYLPPQRRGIGYLLQEYALFPHLSVSGNIAYGLSEFGTAERRRRVEEMLSLFGLADFGNRYPHQLSGGEQQRVALARSLVRRPRVLFLDEPLSALDAPTREQLRRELRRLLAGLGVPSLLVTHDRMEALALGDAVVVLDGGRVRQSGPVQEVFDRPKSAAVARIVGVETVQLAQVLEVKGGLATVLVGKVHLIAAAPKVVPESSHVCIRAEDVLLEEAAVVRDTENRLTGKIEAVVREGPVVRVAVDCGFPLTALVSAQRWRELNLHEGEAVTAAVKPEAVRVVPPE